MIPYSLELAVGYLVLIFLLLLFPLGFPLCFGDTYILLSREIRILSYHSDSSFLGLLFSSPVFTFSRSAGRFPESSLRPLRPAILAFGSRDTLCLSAVGGASGLARTASRSPDVRTAVRKRALSFIDCRRLDPVRYSSAVGNVGSISQTLTRRYPNRRSLSTPIFLDIVLGDSSETFPALFSFLALQASM